MPDIEKIHFYSYNDCKKTPVIGNCIYFKEIVRKDISFPCVVLMRNNTWNDYSYYTNFEGFYLPDNHKLIPLGTICIIHSKAKECKTELPAEFMELPKKEFFSRGKLSFYDKLNSLANIKSTILSALNDIHFYHYTLEDIQKIDIALLYPYINSLFREDYYEIEVSSQYYKNSISMLNKILSCLNSISQMDGENQKIMKKLLFGAVITTLESYLGDAFKYKVLNDKKYYYSFLKNYKFETEKNYSLNELAEHENKLDKFLESKVNEHLGNIIFHKIELVIGLYKKILNVELQPSLGSFKESIQKRHDIFHRNGKNIAGGEVGIEEADIRYIVNKTMKFIGETEKIIIAQT